MPTLLEAFNADFDALATSTASADAIARWHADPALAAPDLYNLIDRIWAADKDEADRRLYALARRAADDLVAARTMLQALRPGIQMLAVRLDHGKPDDATLQAVIAAAWERIRTYPYQRRSERIASNVLLDARKAVVRERLQPWADQVGLFAAVATELQPAAPAAEEVVLDSESARLAEARHLLDDAVRRRAVTAQGAEVVWQTHVLGLTDQEAARTVGMETRTVQRRRQRAERRLAVALAG